MKTLEQVIEGAFRKEICLRESEELSDGNKSLCKDIANAIREELNLIDPNKPHEDKITKEQVVEFNPWDDCEKTFNNKLDITEPPCKHCRDWNPRVKTDSKGAYDGIILCTNSNMNHDFSCYWAKGR